MPSTDPDLSALLASWLLHLRAERKSEQTVKSYGDGVRRFLAWCRDTDRRAVLDRPTVNAFVAELLDNGAEAATARSRQLALRRFSAWMAEEEETPRDDLLGLKPPKLDQKIVPRLTDNQVRAMLKACAGREFRDRRDEAILRFMFETAVRAGEVAAMEVTDVDLLHSMATIRRGKGGKGRTVPFGAQTARAIDRYLRMRRAHPLASTPTLWLGERGKQLGYYGLYRTLNYRAQLAGIENFYPHVTRHTAAQLVIRRRLRGRSHGRGRLDAAGHARPLHPLDRLRACRRGSPAAEPGRPLINDML
jgi:integrase/recombinase XerD